MIADSVVCGAAMATTVTGFDFVVLSAPLPSPPAACPHWPPPRDDRAERASLAVEEP